jgi:hypothetical protein
VVDSLQKDLRRLGTVLTSLKRTCDTIATARDTAKAHADMKQYMDEGKALISDVSSKIKSRLEGFVGAPGIDRTERNTRKAQQQKFVKDLQERVAAYQSVRGLVGCAWGPLVLSLCACFPLCSGCDCGVTVGAGLLAACVGWPVMQGGRRPRATVCAQRPTCVLRGPRWLR